MTRKIIAASHHRSGTHLTIDAMINNFHILKNAPPIASVNLDHLSSTNHWELMPQELQGRTDNIPAVVKIHSHGNIAEYFQGDGDLNRFVSDLFGQSKVIYIHRDGRDVMVSLYFYESRFNQNIKDQPFSAYLRGSSSFDVLADGPALDTANYRSFHVALWIAKDNLLVVSYDDLRYNYFSALQNIAAYIEHCFNVAEPAHTQC